MLRGPRPRKGTSTGRPEPSTEPVVRVPCLGAGVHERRAGLCQINGTSSSKRMNESKEQSPDGGYAARR